MRSAEQKVLNAVQRPEAYHEVVLGSSGARIVLSVWDAATGTPVVLFLPGTMFNEDLATVLPVLLERLQAVVPAREGAPP